MNVLPWKCSECDKRYADAVHAVACARWCRSERRWALITAYALAHCISGTEAEQILLGMEAIDAPEPAKPVKKNPFMDKQRDW